LGINQVSWLDDFIQELLAVLSDEEGIWLEQQDLRLLCWPKESGFC
jgi:hypothetical protein